jgi:hypothetical protein
VRENRREGEDALLDDHEATGRDSVRDRGGAQPQVRKLRARHAVELRPGQPFDSNVPH